MNPDPMNGEMRYRDALIVATVLMLSTIAAVFLPTHTFETWSIDTAKTCYDLFVTAFSSWIAAFMSLTGLTVYAKSKKEG